MVPYNLDQVKKPVNVPRQVAGKERMSADAEISTEETRNQAVSVWAPFWSGAVAKIPDEVLLMSEEELETKFKQTSIDFWLRKRFWEITERNLSAGVTGTVIKELSTGICTTAHIYIRVLTNPYRMAWIMTPIHKHMDMIDEGFNYLLKKVRTELLTMPITEKSAPVIMKALEFFANRALGPMLQKIEQKSLNVAIDGNQAMREALNPIDMQEKFAEVQKKLATMPLDIKVVNDPE